MPTILTHTVTLTTTDKPRIERLINARTAKHPDDERSSHLTGAIGDVAFAAWAEHHRVLVEGPIAHSACNAVIRNRGSWSDRLRIGVRTTDERKGTWQRALRTSGFKVHRLAQARVDVVVLCSVAWDGEHPVVTLRGAFDVPGGVGRRADLELDEEQLVDVTRFLPN
jgi:hypothetical protein